MFNENFILQFSLYLCLLFFSLNLESFFMLINSIIYLILVSVYAWNEDIDILINFLVIIDLGLFFIFFSFLIHTTELFSYQNKKNYLPKLIFFILIFLLYYYYHFSNHFFFLKYTNLINFLYNLNYFNYFNVFNFIFFSDLQLLTELYFAYNFLEFIIMNFYIYIVIVAIYYLVNFNIFLESLSINHLLVKKYQFSTLTFNDFFKVQNLQKQINTPASTRVWSRIKVKLDDSKTVLN